MSSESPADDPTNNTTTEAPRTPRKKPSKLVGQNKNNEIDKAPPPQISSASDNEDEELEPTIAKPRKGSRRMVPVHQSRIADRPAKEGEKDSSLKIKIELDLEVEVELYARVKGDVTIGLI
ncbi:uncharacterized protein ALTATR162_LOCUS2676 [Alternaria atra]|uniref:Uncharacterized protein n=1 Tax=Alternaria atra TaxID=119953 RepID=A0A8J2I2J9_9PLEO|nr:uncharacterized protein ALTATR162_LOCUS2676 [Alternaria atra]CAG5150481.1 unnamed protein product [Alternaria atra]